MPRFILLVRSTPTTEGLPSAPPPADDIYEKVGKFNEELIASGSFVDAGGFAPTKDGYRVGFSKSGPTVAQGPFDVVAETHVSGFWIIKSDSAEEAVGWAKKIPFDAGEVFVRPLKE